MNNEINMHLVKAIADIAIFLEFSDEMQLDPDVSMQAMEQLAAELQLMGDDAKSKLSEQFEVLSQKYQGEQKDFVATLGESFGLI
jgi:hypothetical protein